MRTPIAIVTASLATLAATDTSSAQHAPQWLDLLRDQSNESAVSEHGRATFSHAYYDTDLHRWRHDAGWGVVPLGAPGDSAFLRGVDASGEWIAITHWPALGHADDVRAQRLHVSGTVETLEARVVGPYSTEAYGISGDGSTVVGFVLQGSDEARPCLWDAQGNFQFLGDLPGGSLDGFVSGVSHDGSVVVGSSSVDYECDEYFCWDIYAGYVWTETAGMQPVSPPNSSFWPWGISGDGNVLIGVHDDPASTPSNVATRHVLGQAYVPLLTSNGTGSLARLVNFDGSTIIGTTTGGAVHGHASYTGTFVWFEGLGAYALDDALAMVGAAPPAGTEVLGVAAMSPSGDAWLLSVQDVGGTGPVTQALAYAGPPSLPIGANECGPATVNSTGASATIAASGFGYADGPGLALTASDLPVGSLCMFLASTDADFVAGPGGSQGNLCLGGAIGRFLGAGELQHASGSGTASLTVLSAAVAQPTSRVSIQPGETWRFQAWFRDANPAPTSNFTDAVAEAFE